MTDNQARPTPSEPVGWQKCPVCRGRGEVSGDFYPQHGTLTWETQCRTCKGKGIIPIGQPIDPEGEEDDG